MSRSLRLTLVSPRFEPVTAVGAEVQIARLARLLAGRGHRVEVLTTCVRDSMTWKNHYDPGLTDEGSFSVRRFPSDRRRLSRRSLEIGHRIRTGQAVDARDERQWVESLGFSTALQRYVRESRDRTDAYIFAPALAGTTFAGLPTVAGRSILLAALADGPAARLGVLKELAGKTAFILVGSEAERDLVRGISGRPAERLPLAAAGLDAAGHYDPGRFRRRHGLEVPFLFYAGRRRTGKGVKRLLEYTAALVRHAGMDLRLVLTGEGEIAIPGGLRDFVLDLNFIDEQDKADGLAGALAFCQPSRAEALALAPMESWLAGRPVLAEARGAVTVERCRSGGGGLWYEDYFEFEESVRLLMEERGLADGLGERGRDFVRRHWSWSALIGPIEDACAAAAAAGRTGKA